MAVTRFDFHHEIVCFSLSACGFTAGGNKINETTVAGSGAETTAAKTEDIRKLIKIGVSAPDLINVFFIQKGCDAVSFKRVRR